tara:strand:- start:17 stop:244 length:228 start_codon:yes stop_codon:yes gene_type:complete
MSEVKADSIPDKKAYQVNRRLMCWVALGLLGAMVLAMIIAPEKYEKVAGFDMALMSLSGLVAVYFGATSYQQAKK